LKWSKKSQFDQHEASVHHQPGGSFCTEKFKANIARTFISTGSCFDESGNFAALALFLVFQDLPRSKISQDVLGNLGDFRALLREQAASAEAGESCASNASSASSASNVSSE
jgi:hypothetical protein